MNFKEIRDILYKKLDVTGWDDELRFFIRSSDFIQILEKLHYEKQEGRRFTPTISNIFKPFTSTPFDQTRVVLLVNEGYLNPIYNTGLPIAWHNDTFSPEEYYRLQEQLQLEYPEAKMQPDMFNWTSQGILILPLSLTSQVRKKNRHKDIWAGFLSIVIEVLKKREVVWVSFGKNDFVDNLPNCIQLNELPSVRDLDWKANGLFGKINNQLTEKIIW